MKRSTGLGRRKFLTGTTAGLGGAALLSGGGSAFAATAKPGPRAANPSIGPVTVTPGDQQYQDSVRALNARYVARPDSVHFVDAPEQIPAIVERAVREGKRLSIRSGGHCLEDFVYHADVRAVIDVSHMNGVYYDPARRAVAVESGATLLDLYETLYQAWGITVPGGICYSVGVGGHVSGGGWGMLARRDGLVVDHLYAVEVVVVDASGRARTVLATREKDDPHRELWWAHTGGGGGNFGVITRYFFRSPDAVGDDPRTLLPKPPAEVLLSAVSWPWAKLSGNGFARLAQNYASWHVAHGAADGPQRFLTSFLILNHQANGQIGLVTQVDAAAPGAQRMLEEYLAYMGRGVSVGRGALTRQMGDIGPMPQFAAARRLPWLQATRFVGTTNPLLNDPTLRAEYKSAYMRAEFPRAHLDAMYKHLTRTDIASPNLNIQLTPFGGAVRRVGHDATAAGHRDAAFKMLWSAQWNDTADDAKYVAWTRESYQEVYARTGGVPVPDGVTDGCYVNYPDADLSDPRYNTSGVPWHELYYKDAYPRLQRIKKVYDPRNVFRHRQSVELPN
ncbi:MULTISPECIES: FAD-binding oxidoreductase [Streptomyces]|uniref:FAD-linked oxidase n=1 Tax=Streptomyces badius TaxID=1941 RepID=A0ABQ2SYZ5_STRBA|nr:MULTISPECIES: FAD-binding oxidoreductase [Streptomyces]GGS44417.1 FAD-linked oxidase [Streptomyces badius]